MSDDILKAVKAIRDSDCGEWLKDCQTGLFSCAEGREKRHELRRLLDDLYMAAYWENDEIEGAGQTKES